MKEPSRQTIETTKGAITVRAMTRREINALQKLRRDAQKATDEDMVFDLQDQMEAAMLKCIVSGVEVIDDIEGGEFVLVMNAIHDVSREYKEKNLP